MYDEEVNPNSDDEFSDDEQEKAFRKVVKKVKNQRKRRHDPPSNPSTQPNPNFIPPYSSKKRDQK